MVSHKVPESLAEQVDDPEGARLVAELFERFSALAKQLGSAAPLIQAISASFALMDDSSARSEYDEGRRLLIRYLESLDGSDIEQHEGTKPYFKASPDVSREALVTLASALQKR